MIPNSVMTYGSVHGYFRFVLKKKRHQLIKKKKKIAKQKPTNQKVKPAFFRKA